MKTPYEIVMEHYKFPFEGRKYQIETINELAPLPRAGIYLDTGTGKTYVSTVIALFKMLHGAEVVIGIMPPILLLGWYRWLTKIGGVHEDDVLIYRGTPKKRKAFELKKYKFILMSMNIFKNDNDRLWDVFGKTERVVIVDEATSIKNVETGNYKAVRDFTHGQHLLPLTGTPLTTPIDGYAFIKLMAPTIYRNKNHFENVHVEERDFFGNISKWKNLDLLKENLKVNSVRLLKTDVLHDLPPVSFDPITYELEPDHYKLYKALAEDQLLPLKDGGKIDATVEQALHHALQQIVCNYGHFADDQKLTSAALELMEEVLEELGDKKLVVFAKYRMTNRLLLEKFEKYNPVAAYGDISSAQQSKNIDRFINDDSCRLFIAQPTSAGYGVDGLQHVCQDALFLELPDTPRDFHQAVARLWREGQEGSVNIRIAVAAGTLQVRKLNQMLSKDELVSKVQRSYMDLRAAIFGE